MVELCGVALVQLLGRLRLGLRGCVLTAATVVWVWLAAVVG